MADISTNSVKTNSLKIHIMPKAVNDEYIANNLINENELYLVEDNEPIPLSEGGTGVKVNDVVELRTVLGVAATDHTSTDRTCGVGTDVKFGHVKLSDSIELESDVNQGLASTPKAVNALYQLIQNLYDTKADINSSGIITSLLSHHAEVCEWDDGNNSDEDRIGYFVSLKTGSNNTITKSVVANSILGVTVEHAGFATSAGAHKYIDDVLTKQYDYVVMTGCVTVIDNGRCEVNTKCMSDNFGTAIPSINDTGFHVISRVDDNHILILLESGIVPLIGIKDELDNKQNRITWTTTSDIDAMLAGTYVPDSTTGSIDDDDLILMGVREQE